MTENITGNSSGNHHLQENAAAFDDDELYDCDTYDEGDDQSPLSDGMYEHFRFVADKGFGFKHCHSAAVHLFLAYVIDVRHLGYLVHLF